MTKRILSFVVLLFIMLGCSGVKAPKQRLDRNSSTFDSDLIQLKEYLGEMPVDVVVAGYKPETRPDIPVVFSSDSIEATVKQAVILDMNPTYTYLRPRGGITGNYLRIPTSNVTRVAADGFRSATGSSRSGAIWILPILTGAFAIIAALTYKNVFSTDGWTGCLFVIAGLLAAGICVVSTILILLTQPSVGSDTFERISKFWTFQ